MEKETKGIGIHIGAMCDPIHKQLKKQGVNVSSSDCNKYQRAHDGLIQLRFLGCLGDSEYDRTVQRLAGKISKFAEQKLKSPTP